MTRRILTGGVAAIATLLLATGTALAGGWATITPDATAAGDEPRAGETDVFGFTILQHGVTPAGWVHATVVVENISTGETIRAAATPKGADGHFVANVKFPEAGYWSWQVEITDLIPESPPRLLTVLTADGAIPPLNPTIALTMIERAKSDLREEIATAYESRISSLETSLSAVQFRATNLERQRDVLVQRVTAAEAAATASPAGGGVPVAATLALAVLAGGAAGFVMVSLGRRGGRPEVDTSSVQEYAPTTH